MRLGAAEADREYEGAAVDPRGQRGLALQQVVVEQDRLGRPTVAVVGADDLRERLEEAVADGHPEERALIPGEQARLDRGRHRVARVGDVASDREARADHRVTKHLHLVREVEHQARVVEARDLAVASERRAGTDVVAEQRQAQAVGRRGRARARVGQARARELGLRGAPGLGARGREDGQREGGEGEAHARSIDGARATVKCGPDAAGQAASHRSRPTQAR